MKLKCTFGFFTWPFVGIKYSCKATHARITEPTEVEAFIGKQIKGKTNDDVEILFIGFQMVEHFPKGLLKIFPNLTVLMITECGLKQIKKEDLVGFGKLEVLHLWGNKITVLEEDLLMNTPKLRYVSFRSNLIEKVPSKFLEPVSETLEIANFHGNKQLNYYFNVHDKNALRHLMTKVIEQSNELSEERQKAEVQSMKIADLTKKDNSQFKLFSGMFASGDYSDLSLKIHGKVLKVHTCILASQSSVFAELFGKNNEADKVEGMKKILDFGEEIFIEFLRYFYTRSLQSEEHVNELLQLAAEFKVSELKALCEDAILKGLCEANAVEVLKLGVPHSEKLKRAATDLLKKKDPEIPKFLFEDPEALNGFIKAKYNFAVKK